jgi:hypothetical protein
MVRLVNRARMTTPTTGTGTLTLGGAVAGFQSFAAAGVLTGDALRYVIEEGEAWEIGTGVYGAAGPTLTRTPSESSAGGAAIALGGQAVVYITAAAAEFDAKLDATDPRLSDAREWSAATLSQAEAEAGTATTRRAFTAARVRQAILGWWNGSAEKTKLDGIAAGAEVNVGTDLGLGGSGNARTITSSTGNAVTVSTASTTHAGFMSTGDKAKLDGIAAGAEVNAVTSVAGRTGAVTLAKGDVGLGAVDNTADSAKVVASAATWTTGRTLTLGDSGKTLNGGANLAFTLAEIGAAAALHGHAEATTSAAGFLSAADKTKLSGIATGATANAGTVTSVSGGTGLSGTVTTSGSIALAAISAGSATTGALFYNGTTRASGQLYGGTTAPASTTRLNYDGALHVTTLTASSDITSLSDERLKTDWAELPPDFIARIASVRHGTFRRRDGTRREIGVSAQSLARVLPEAVREVAGGNGEAPPLLAVAHAPLALAAVVAIARAQIALGERLAVIEARLGVGTGPSDP